MLFVALQVKSRSRQNIKMRNACVLVGRENVLRVNRLYSFLKEEHY